MLSGECLDILSELKEVIAQFGSAAPTDYLWGAEQLLDAVGLWPLLPKIQAAMPWMMSFAMSMIPGWGDLYDLAGAVMGYDLITGQSLDGWQRWLTAAAALIPFISGAQLRSADNFLEAEADVAKAFRQGCSFDGDTPVTTEDGQRPINQINIGDHVLAWNEQTNSTGYYTVTATMAHIDPQIVHLTINGETIETTPEHPFYVVVSDSWMPLSERGEWIAAGALQTGDAIRKADGTSGLVSKVNVTADTQVMYNLTVDSVHTYVVGDGQWVVHNASCPIRFADLDAQIASGMTKKMQQSVVETIREGDDPGMILAFRGTADGSYIWNKSGLYSKPKSAETLFSGPCGLRYCSYQGGGLLTYSDLDGAWGVFSNGQSIGDDFYMERIAPIINKKYGVQIINHGNYIQGLEQGVTLTSWTKIADPVYMFDYFGYTGQGPMWGTYELAQQGRLLR